MESVYTKLALYGSTNQCTRTDNVFFPISEVYNGTVSPTTICHDFNLAKIYDFWRKLCSPEIWDI